MKELRNFIKENKELFDDIEPKDGHFERFEARLDQQAKKESGKARRIKFRNVFAVAASVAILLGMGIYFYMPSGEDQKVSVEREITDEFIRTNDFYKKQMDKQIADITCKLENADETTKNQLEKDLQLIVEENERFVANVEKGTDEERAIYYLVKHYKTNIQVLEQINDKLGKYNQC